MARMSQKEVERWQDRLRFSHHVWRRQGIGTADSRSEDGGTPIWALLNAYRSITFNADGWGGIPYEELIEVPSGFALINTLMAQLFARFPVVDVTAQSPSSQDAARKMETLLNTLSRTRNLKMKSELNEALRHALITPLGIIRHGFTPREEMVDSDGRRLERYQAAKPDVPWIRAVPLWDVRFDPTARSFDPRGDLRWVAFRNLFPMSTIERNPNLVKRKDLRANRKIDLPGYGEDTRGLDPDDSDLVEAWTVYEVEERTWFTLVEGLEQPIRNRDDWPIQWENLPVNVLAFNPQMDTPFPIAPIDSVRHQILERNKARTLMSQLVKRSRRLVYLNQSVVNDDDQRRLTAGDPDLMEFVRGTGTAGEAIREIPLGGLDQTLLLYDERMLEDMREALGQSLLSRGQRINVETATEAGAVQAGSDLQQGRLAGPFEDFLSDVFATFGDALQSPGVLGEEITVPILGRQDSRELFGQLDASPFRTIRSEEIRGTFIYEVRAGSTTPRNPAQRLQEAASDLQIASQFPENVRIDQLLVDYFIERDKDPAQVLQSPQEITQTQQQMSGQTQQTEAGPPLPAELLRQVG